MAFFVTVPLVALTLAFVFIVRSSSKPEPKPDAPVDEAPAEELSKWKKARKRGYWASSISLAFVYMITGLPKLTGLGELVHRFGEWGYPDEFMLFVGASEFIAAIFLLIPGTSFYAATYLGTIMAGAIYTHLAFDSALWALIPAFCLSFLAFIAYEDWVRANREES